MNIIFTVSTLIIFLSFLGDSIFEVEGDMEKLSQTKKDDPEETIRLVSEYNCQVACGLPVHNWVFKHYHDEINKLWMKRNKTS